MVSSSKIDFGFVVQPFIELTDERELIPIADYSQGYILRCKQCQAFVNPCTRFTEFGAKAVCNLCFGVTDVPTEYQSQLNEFG